MKRDGLNNKYLNRDGESERDRERERQCVYVKGRKKEKKISISKMGAVKFMLQ